MDRSRASSTGAHSVMTAGSGISGSEATRRAYLAHAQRRRPPPRFRPYMIIVLVLSAGLLLIGLTMTIIGLWPSYSPSGGNPLQIVGPLMLGIGLLGIIGSIVNICYKREQEKKKLLKSISDMRSSRQTLASTTHYSQQMTPTPSVNARPSKGILKSSSTATSVNGTVKGSENESDSGMANLHSFQSNRSYERDSNSSDMSRNLDNIKVEMNPDPTASRHGRPVDQSSTGSDQGVPPASMGAPRNYNQQQRHIPKQSRHAKPQPQYSNQGYSPDGQETDIDADLSRQPQPQHHRQMQNYGYSGYDAYDQSAGITGGGGLTGGGALGSPGEALGSPYGTPQKAPPAVVHQARPQQAQMQQSMATPQPQPQTQQPRTRWGAKSPRSPQPVGGQLNASYTHEVSTVSEQYHQAQQQYGPPSSGGGHYTSYAHSGDSAAAARAPSSSTEV